LRPPPLKSFTVNRLNAACSKSGDSSATATNPLRLLANMKILLLFLIMSSILLASRQGARALHRQQAG
jgi:hypothetical protein